MTRLNGLRSALAGYRIGIDTETATHVYLDIKTGTVFTETINYGPAAGEIMIDSEIMKRYGHISMDTIKNYCNNHIYNSRLVIDSENPKNPIFNKIVTIDWLDIATNLNVLGFTEPEILSIHISKIGENKADKTLDAADRLCYNNTIAPMWLAGVINSIEAELKLNRDKTIEIKIKNIEKR